MTKLILIAGAMLSLAASPVVAREARPAAAPDTQTDATARAENPAQKYCVVNYVTGSRIGQKTCKTRAEWQKSDGFDPLAKHD